MDPELRAAAASLPPLAFSDLDTIRRTMNDFLGGRAVDRSGVVVEDRVVPESEDLAAVAVRMLLPESDSASQLRGGVLSIHGGGFALGLAKMDDGSNAQIVRETGAVVVSVDYRLAPENPFPGPADDCYAALVWLAEHATELGVDPTRIIVLGVSAGATLAATTALMARERGGPAIALQVLLEPSLDDRLRTPSMRNGTDTVGWNNSLAAQSWDMYLAGKHDIPPALSVPAREVDLAGLPPAYISVNELDCLRDEGLEFAGRLLAAGVSTELHVWPGTFHGAAGLVPGAEISRCARAVLHDALRRGLRTQALVASEKGTSDVND